MNSGSNSSRNLIASGDLVISLFLSHKALYPSHTQAYTHLYASAAAHKHTHTRTQASTCLPPSPLLLSCSLPVHLRRWRVQRCKNDPPRHPQMSLKNRCTRSYMNTHTHTHTHTLTHTNTHAHTHTHRCSFTKAARHNISHEPKPLII